MQLILSHDGQGGSLTVHQDMTLHQIRLQPDQQTDYAPAPNRTLYVHIITGELQVHNVLLSAGDSATIKLDEGQCNINFQALQNTEALLFDLA